MEKVLIGGFLAILGGISSQFLISWLAEKREVSKVKRERLELLVKAIYAHEQWISEKKDKMVFKNEGHESINPIDEARMLQALYFPELAESLAHVISSSIPLVEFIYTKRREHIEDRSAFIENYNPEEYNLYFKVYIEAIAGLVRRCRQLV